MSNDNLNNAKEAANQAKKAAGKGLTVLRRFAFIPLTIGTIYFANQFGLVGAAWHGTTALVNGAEIVQVTNTGETSRRGMVESCDAAGVCTEKEVQVKVSTVSITRADGTPLKVDNRDSSLFLKYNTNDVDALASDLAKNASAGGNDYAVMYTSGRRQAMPDWIIEDGLNRNLISLYEYVPNMTEAEYDALPSARQGDVMYGDIGHFSFGALTWQGIAWGTFWALQMFCMTLAFLAFSFGKSARPKLGLLLGPVGVAGSVLLSIGKRIFRRATKKKDTTPEA